MKSGQYTCVCSLACLIGRTPGTAREDTDFTRTVLAEASVKVSPALLVSKPHESRRSYAMMRKLWLEIEVVCATTAMGLEECPHIIGDAHGGRHDRGRLATRARIPGLGLPSLWPMRGCTATA